MPKAIRNNVLVKVAEAEEVTTGGLILTAAAVEKPNYGFVKNVGDGYSYPTTGVRVPMVVKEGDCVLYGKYAVDEVEIDEEDHAIISQDAVLAIVDGEYKSENVRPIFDTIFIKRDSTANELSSGIVLTGSKTEKSNIGTVRTQLSFLSSSRKLDDCPVLNNRHFVSSHAHKPKRVTVLL